MKNSLPKIVHVDHEQKMSLDEAITFLDSIVTKLKEDRKFTLHHHGKTHVVKPSNRVELEIKLEQRGKKHEFELELEWIEGAEGSDLTIG